jgi:plasmid maintenance system antidote protein VapI
VETIGRIRREHFIKGKTIKELARELKVSRNTSARFAVGRDLVRV